MAISGAMHADPEDRRNSTSYGSGDTAHEQIIVSAEWRPGDYEHPAPPDALGGRVTVNMRADGTFIISLQTVKAKARGLDAEGQPVGDPTVVYFGDASKGFSDASKQG